MCEMLAVNYSNPNINGCISGIYTAATLLTVACMLETLGKVVSPYSIPNRLWLFLMPLVANVDLIINECQK